MRELCPLHDLLLTKRLMFVLRQVKDVDLREDGTEETDQTCVPRGGVCRRDGLSPCPDFAHAVAKSKA